MITIFNTKTRKNHTFENTRFPDGTSQAWKVTPEPTKNDEFFVTWQFTCESEFVTLLQLAELLSSVAKVPRLYMPFLPWGRQDKAIKNDQTFAGHVLLSMLDDVYYLETFDAHSLEMARKFRIHNHEPEEFFKSILDANIYDAIVFPDDGARKRYKHLFGCLPVIVMDKKRNQQTGEIEGLVIDSKNTDVVKNHKPMEFTFLIVDDICDGGRTFIETYKTLNDVRMVGEKINVDLAVSHGIFSKGKQVLHDAGIRNIFTTNSLPKNAGQFNVLF